MASLNINGKVVPLMDDGVTGGGRQRMKAQVYVNDIGTVFIRTYSQPIVGALPREPEASAPTPPQIRERLMPAPTPIPHIAAFEARAKSDEVTVMVLETLKAMTARLNDFEKALQNVNAPKRMRRYAKRNTQEKR